MFAYGLEWSVSLKLYLISCELLCDGGDYRSLRERIRTLGGRELLGAVWALRSQYTASELKNLLKEYLAPDDRIVVTEVGGEWASRKARTNLGEL